MNIDQVYDELYGVIDKNKAADAATQGKVADLEETVSTQGTTIATHTGQITALETAIPEVPGRQLKLVDLGTEYTQELKEDIYTGTFEKAVVGGFLTLNGHKYIFAHADYWLNAGDSSSGVTDHHMVVIPANILGQGAMNLTATTDGGYALSDMRAGHTDTTDPDNPVHVEGALKAVIDIIENDFGASNLLTHKEFFVNAMTDGVPSGNAWYDSTIDLMNEPMLYGCFIKGTPYGTIDKTQLKLFQERPDLITIRNHYWLRDTTGTSKFANAAHSGIANHYNANSATIGIRPVFAIKGAPPETRTKKRKG